jgi:hypothetical protein
MNYRAITLLAASLFLTSYACTADALPEPQVGACDNIEPTYAQDIQPIIENSCAYSGCHLDGSDGNFQSFAGLRPYLEDRSFRTRVISEREDDIRGMPPNYAPANRPQDLTLEELDLINCWLAAGFPE